jgi:hypothetical protein
LRLVELVADGKHSLIAWPKGRQQQGPDCLVHHKGKRQAKLPRELTDIALPCKDLISKPIGGTEKFAGEDVGLNLLALFGGIALRRGDAAVEFVAAKTR